MTFLFILLILIAMFLYGMKEYYQIKLGMRPQHTPEATIAYLAQVLERSAESGNFLNLSSGYGGVVLEVAKRLPTWQVIGVERSPTPWVLANIRSIGKNFGNYRFFLEDPLQHPLKDYNVIFLNQEPKIIKQWEATLARRLQPGTLFISCNAPLPRIKPLEVMNVNPTTKLYIYKKPVPNEADAAQTLPVEAVSPVIVQPPVPVEEPLIVTEPVSETPAEQPAGQPI